MNTNIFKRFLVLMIPILFLGILISCGGANSSVNNDQEFSELQQIVTSRNFEIEHEWANPLVGSQINLIGNTNYIRFHGDSVDVYLPFFGERYSGGAYDGEGGIKYEGFTKEFEVIQNPDKSKIELKFKIEKTSENFDFFITLYPNNKARTSVNTSERSTITYEGKLIEMKEN